MSQEITVKGGEGLCGCVNCFCMYYADCDCWCCCGENAGVEAWEEA